VKSLGTILDTVTAYVAQRLSGVIDLLALEPHRITSHDRALLEDIILPYFARTAAVGRVLFVGCSAYTQWYQQLFDDRDYWTIDPKAAKRKYGAERHIVDSITQVQRYVAPEYFDVIVMNGVIGFGLNRLPDIERAIEACYAVLAADGVLLVGWNDTARRTPVDLRSVRALSRFREYYFEPLQACHVRADGAHRHTFSFYQKKARG
jgi:hypothetical protein